MLTSFDINGDFWLQNPLIGLIPPYNLLKKMENSSSIMWAIAMVEDPNSYNRLFAFKRTERLAWVCKDYLDIHPLVFEEDYKEYIEAYKSVVLDSKEEIEYYEWSKKIEERNNFMHKTPYDELSFEMLDKMIKSHDSIWKIFREAGKALFAKEELAKTRANIEESESSRGLI